MDLELRNKQRQQLDTRLERQRLGHQIPLEEFRKDDIVLVDETWYGQSNRFSKTGRYRARLLAAPVEFGKLAGMVGSRKYIVQPLNYLDIINNSCDVVPLGYFDRLTLLVPGV